MQRRHFLGALGALSALSGAGCTRPDPAAPSQDAAPPFDPAPLQQVLETMLAQQTWAQALSEYPQGLLDLQSGLSEAGMVASAAMVGMLGGTLMPALGAALLGLDTESEQDAKDALKRGWSAAEGTLASLLEGLPDVRSEMDAQGWLGPTEGADQILSDLNETEVGAREFTKEQGLEGSVLANMGLMATREHKAWLREGGDSAQALDMAEAGLGGLLERIESAREEAGTRGPPPPPLADWAEAICDELGVPGWFDYVFGTALGYSSDSCDEERWLAESTTLTVMAVLGVAGILGALFKGSAFFGLLVFSGPIGFILLLVYVLFTSMLVVCRFDHIFDTMLECGI